MKKLLSISIALLLIAGQCDAQFPFLFGKKDGYENHDGDAYGRTDRKKIFSSFKPLPSGYSAIPGDCDDANDQVYPGAAEICNNGIDDNCNGQYDDGLTVNTYYVDSNFDGYIDNISKFISTCITPMPAGYSITTAPKATLVINDSHIPVIKDLWSFTDVDIFYNGSGKNISCRAPRQEPYRTLVSNIFPASLCAWEGATTDHQYYLIGDTLLTKKGRKTSGYNCEKDGPTVLQAACGIQYLLNGEPYDFFNSHVAFIKSLGCSSTLTVNVQQGTLQELYWALDRSRSSRVIFGQEQNLGSNASWYPNGVSDYISKVNAWSDSVHKHYPGTITVMDAGPITSPAKGNVNWDDGLSKSCTCDEVDMYANLNDNGFSGNFDSDTLYMSQLMNSFLPQWIDQLAAKFPKKNIAITQWSPGETFHPDVEVYPGTFFGMEYNIRFINMVLNYNRTHSNKISYACYETLKSLIDKNNQYDLNYQGMLMLANLFSEPATMLNVTQSSGALIFGVKTLTGKVKLISFNYTPTDKQLPTTMDIDGFHLNISWGSDFLGGDNAKSTALMKSKAPIGQTIEAYTVGYTEINLGF